MTVCDICEIDINNKDVNTLRECYQVRGIKDLCKPCMNKVGRVVMEIVKQQNKEREMAVKKFITSMKRPVKLIAIPACSPL
jgi:hypothetical protein